MDIRLLDESRPFAEINIIPFVDIILVVLIIFMVATPFTMKTGLSLNLPQAGSSSQVKTPEWYFTIQTNGDIALNNQVMSLEEIATHIQSHTQQNPQTPRQALIAADKNVLHGKVISVINILQSLGINKVSIATQKKEKTP